MHARRTDHLLRAGLTRKMLRGPRVEQRSYGLVRPSGLSTTPPQERLDDALGLLLPGTALGGWAALLHHGMPWFDGWAPDGGLRRALVHCGPGTQLRRRDLLEPFRGVIHPREITEVEGVRVSTIERAAFDEARLAVDVRAAVVAIDMSVSSVQDGPSARLADVRRVIADHFKVKGIVRARHAVELASERSASPLESCTRLVAHLDADLENLRANVPVFDARENLLGVVDLIDPETGLVIETDGRGHREEEQHALDNRREEALEDAGCVVVRVTAVDHRDRWGVVERLYRGTRAARRPRPQSWTLDPPSWWQDWPGAQRWAR